MKIAVATTDGSRVDQHFGKADRFLIYELTASGLSFIEERNVRRLSENDPDHPFNEEVFFKIAEALDGCQKIYAARIGDNPAKELKKTGIEPVVYEGPIEEIHG